MDGGGEMNNKDFEMSIKYENIPIFKGKGLSMKDIKRKLRDLECKFK